MKKEYDKIKTTSTNNISNFMDDTPTKPTPKNDISNFMDDTPVESKPKPVISKSSANSSKIEEF